MKTNVFDSDNINLDDIKKEIKKNNNKNLDLYIADLYSYKIVMMYIY